MWVSLAILALLTATLSGHSSPAPPGQRNTSRAESEPLEPGQLLGVRLVNGSSRCSGTVEILLHGAWERACGTLWDRRAAEAACRALGCGGAGAAARPPSPAPGLPWPVAGNASAAPVPAVWCSGAEWRLCEVVEHACRRDARPAQVTCAENRALRLADGGGPCAGRVEMLEGGEWGSVCDDSWDLADAHVVCRQLRCGWAVQAVPGSHFAPGQGPVHRDEVNCSGAEDYLWDCPGLPGDQYCGHKEDAGVLCAEHQSWRLTGGTDPCEGQVEVHYQGVWSTVCDSEWYPPEAEVLCRALGCGTPIEMPKGLPHSLPGRMYYSCRGEEATLSDCNWRFNNSNLCSQSRAARVLCSGSRRLHNLSMPEVLTSLQPVTVASSVTVKTEDKDSQALILLILCIILGIFLLASLISLAFILLKVKGKYAYPFLVDHQHLPTSAGVHSYQEVPITIPKEEVPKLPIQAQAPPPNALNSSSDSDYEHYDFSTQPPVALTTFYNSQRHRVTDQEVQQTRFQMPPLEEGLEEVHASRSFLPTLRCCIADPPSLDPQHRPRNSCGSSTSSDEDYCNSPSSRQPPWTPQEFASERSPLPEQPSHLELAGFQVPPSRASADDSSSTSSGEWYQNFQPPPQSPPQPPSVEQFEHPGSPSPPASSTDIDDYDDIGAS